MIEQPSVFPRNQNVIGTETDLLSFNLNYSRRLYGIAVRHVRVSLNYPACLCHIRGFNVLDSVNALFCSLRWTMPLYVLAIETTANNAGNAAIYEIRVTIRSSKTSYRIKYFPEFSVNRTALLFHNFRQTCVDVFPAASPRISLGIKFGSYFHKLRDTTKLVTIIVWFIQHESQTRGS